MQRSGKNLPFTHEKYQDENDEKLELLKNKLSSLKHITINIGKEVEQHNRLLDDFQNVMGQSDNLLKSSMKRLVSLAKMNSGSFLFLFIIFAIFMIFFVYLFF